MKKIEYMLWIATAILMIGCGKLDKPHNEEVNGGKIVVDFDAGTIKSSLLERGIPGITEKTTVYGYKAYKIPYTTTDEEGNSVAVSGLMVVPKGLPKALIESKGYSVVSDSHGTIFANIEAPSVTAERDNSPAGSSLLLTSLFGFVTLQADYIGFGDALNHYHPYLLKKSLANATVDFIEAAKTFAQNNAIHLNHQLFLTGYSEGGYAAMATLQKIENEGRLHVTLAAPMAGPYALDIMAKGVLSKATIGVPSFMANFAYAYSLAYDEDIASILNEPYATQLESLFDGSKRRVEIDAKLTKVTTGEEGLFNPAFINTLFSNSDFWFNGALEENTLQNWAPKTAVRLLHCQGDDVVPYAISDLTNHRMKSLGAKNISLIPVEKLLLTQGLGNGEPVGHAQCGLLAYGVAGNIFAETRKSTIGY